MDQTWLWVGFNVFVLAMLAVDLLVFHREAHEVRVREARESCYRFMTAMAGNEPGYEEAVRALFAGNCERFQEETAQWPADVRDHARGLAERSC